MVKFGTTDVSEGQYFSWYKFSFICIPKTIYKSLWQATCDMDVSIEVMYFKTHDASINFNCFNSFLKFFKYLTLPINLLSIGSSIPFHSPELYLTPINSASISPKFCKNSVKTFESSIGTCPASSPSSVFNATAKSSIHYHSRLHRQKFSQ